MFFKRVNMKTIRCIISEEDLLRSGIELEDIFARKPKAIDFIKGVISRAVESEDFKLTADMASMKITVMPDRSISLTLSMDPAESPEDILLDANAGDRYIYRFADFRELIQCCRHLSGADNIRSSLYADDENNYYLMMGRTEGAVDYERMVLSANEFGELFGSTPEQEAYVREHGRCLIDQDAIAALACL